MSDYDPAKAKVKRAWQTDKLCAEFTAHGLLEMLHPYQLGVLYTRASRLMDWDDQEAEEAAAGA